MKKEGQSNLGEPAEPDAPLGSTGLAVAGAIPIPRPVVDAKEFRAAMDEFMRLRNSILTGADTVTIGSGPQKRTFIKKSGFQKIAMAYNLSHRVVEREQVVLAEGHRAWRVEVEVRAPNGRIAAGAALCALAEIASRFRANPNALASNMEKFDSWAYATAETRAFNRAVSAMVGGADVSAEELDAPDPNGRK